MFMADLEKPPDATHFSIGNGNALANRPGGTLPQRQLREESEFEVRHSERHRRELHSDFCHAPADSEPPEFPLEPFGSEILDPPEPRPTPVPPLRPPQYNHLGSAKRDRVFSN